MDHNVSQGSYKNWRNRKEHPWKEQALTAPEANRDQHISKWSTDGTHAAHSNSFSKTSLSPFQQGQGLFCPTHLELLPPTSRSPWPTFLLLISSITLTTFLCFPSQVHLLSDTLQQGKDRAHTLACFTHCISSALDSVFSKWILSYCCLITDIQSPGYFSTYPS
jgi:hypothetical protein